MDLNKRIENYIKNYIISKYKSYFECINNIVIINKYNNSIDYSCHSSLEFYNTIMKVTNEDKDSNIYYNFYKDNNFIDFFYNKNKYVTIYYDDFFYTTKIDKFMFHFIPKKKIYKTKIIRRFTNLIYNTLPKDEILNKLCINRKYNYNNLKEELINKVNLKEHKKIYKEVMNDLLYNPFLQFNNGKRIEFYKNSISEITKNNMII